MIGEHTTIGYSICCICRAYFDIKKWDYVGDGGNLSHGICHLCQSFIVEPAYDKGLNFSDSCFDRIKVFIREWHVENKRGLLIR